MGWSTWGLFLVTGILQGILLGMGIWFEFGGRMRRKDSEDVSNGQVEEDGGGEGRHSESGEETPLLGGR